MSRKTTKKRQADFIRSSGGAWSRFHSSEPCREALACRIERLTDILHEIEESEQHDVRHGERRAADERLVAHQTIEPCEPLACDSLEIVGRLRDAADTVLEELDPFGIAKGIHRRLDDVE